RWLPLQLRPGDAPRARLRRAVPPHAHRARRPAAGSVRAGRGVRWLGALGGVVLLVSAPAWLGGTYYVDVASQILLYAVFALGVNVLVGYAGLVSLGHAGLFGIAAYTGGRLLNGGHDHLAVAAGALGATLVASAVFAVLALRGTGLGFVMITVALGQIVW